MTKAIAVALLLGISLCLFGQAVETKKAIAAAEKGNPEAQDRLGTRYRGGIGVRQDKSEAVRWYRMAAQQGYTPAIYNLGTCYYNGEGVTPDDVQAYAYFVIAASGGSKEAADAVRRSEDELSSQKAAAGKILAAEILAAGIEVPANGQAAIAILNELPETSDRELLLKAAEMARHSRTLTHDYSLAYRLCERAANVDSREAFLCLAEMNENGDGRKSDSLAAVDWYLKAVRDGSDLAAIRLAKMYAEGRGVKGDVIQAFLLLKWAAIDSVSAQNSLTEPRTKMSASEIAEAERRFRDWRP